MVIKMRFYNPFKPHRLHLLFFFFSFCERRLHLMLLVLKDVLHFLI